MGCGTSSSNNQGIAPKKKIDNIEDFKLDQADLIGEKKDILKDYKLLNPPLGKGAFGEVRKAIHKITNVARAVKIISKKHAQAEEIESLRDEVEMLRKLDHPNIIKVNEFYQDSRFFYIVTELCSGGELFDKIIEEKTFTERKAAETMKQILSAVMYCHANKIVHRFIKLSIYINKNRDLKPENILYETNKPGSLLKIVDFGTGRVFDPNVRMSQKIGTPYYIAPEVLNNYYDQSCDLWSCGVILYILLSGTPPFNGQDDWEIMEAVKKGHYRFPDEDWKDVSKQAKVFVYKLLEKDFRKRITAKQALEDEWIKIYCEKEAVDLPSLQRSLINMKNFRQQKKLQEASLMFMINFLATKEEKNALLKQFQALDVNGDGRLSKEELIRGYRRVLNEAQAVEEVERIMQQVDKNDSGEIDYSEWVVATINREAILDKDRLDKAFKMFDSDNSGTISISEIKTVFGQNIIISDSVWRELIREVDQNSDGEISYQEFKDMMLKIQNAKL